MSDNIDEVLKQKSHDEAAVSGVSGQGSALPKFIFWLGLILILAGVIYYMRNLTNEGSGLKYVVMLSDPTYYDRADSNRTYALYCAAAGIGLLFISYFMSSMSKLVSGQKKAASPVSSSTDQLFELKKLLDSDIITKEEYEDKRKKMLDLL
jgi:hypothetical protein